MGPLWAVADLITPMAGPTRDVLPGGVGAAAAACSGHSTWSPSSQPSVSEASWSLLRAIDLDPVIHP